MALGVATLAALTLLAAIACGCTPPTSAPPAAAEAKATAADFVKALVEGDEAAMRRLSADHIGSDAASSQTAVLGHPTGGRIVSLDVVESPASPFQGRRTFDAILRVTGTPNEEYTFTIGVVSSPGGPYVDLVGGDSGSLPILGSSSRAGGRPFQGW
jgi:hypothetical protein